MIGAKIIGALMVSLVAIFGGRNILQRLIHEHKVRQNRRFQRKVKQAWQRQFKANQDEIDRYWEDDHKPEKRQNIICKDPKWLPAWT